MRLGASASWLRELWSSWHSMDDPPRHSMAVHGSSVRLVPVPAESEGGASGTQTSLFTVFHRLCPRWVVEAELWGQTRCCTQTGLNSHSTTPVPCSGTERLASTPEASCRCSAPRSRGGSVTAKHNRSDSSVPRISCVSSSERGSVVGCALEMKS